jgi:hypothetical protein
LAREVVDGLVGAKLVEISAGTSRDAIIAAVQERFASYWTAEATLDTEAERLAERHIASAGREGVGLDRRRVVQMIKTKLAAERGIPL